MNDTTEAWMREPERPALPLPTRSRWQPLRIGLVELFHYDSEEFWFRDGHLLLRGNNGTGKSKVLSLTLPFLLDAQLKPSRIEPDGDAGKKMAWNLLLGSYERRIGYAWIEFGRLAEDGTPQYLALGAGLSAAAARPQVDSWFFVLDGARINHDLWLTNEQRTVLAKERLRDALEGRGQVFDTAAAYRRAVDERLFRLGTKRYEALMDTLIQLRQPQLSKKPDEAALSHALTEALPPLASELLGDVAEALNRLEEDRRQLDEYQALAKAVERFERRYRVYAGASSRRQARALRQAQSEFDGASRARSDAQQ
ncbi:MAG TPA: TIGR02680 family protein, partial [Rubrivivax sp.]|nr:TIGR02680 family protein [Rubrivivax sp.]